MDVFAHGYICEPAGRSYLGKLGYNNGCGDVKWEPQSVKGPDGSPRFQTGRPEDGITHTRSLRGGDHLKSARDLGRVCAKVRHETRHAGFLGPVIERQPCLT